MTVVYTVAWESFLPLSFLLLFPIASFSLELIMMLNYGVYAYVHRDYSKRTS